jgi:hypothetical protein
MRVVLQDKYVMLQNSHIVLKDYQRVENYLMQKCAQDASLLLQLQIISYTKKGPTDGRNAHTF